MWQRVGYVDVAACWIDAAARWTDAAACWMRHQRSCSGLGATRLAASEARRPRRLWKRTSRGVAWWSGWRCGGAGSREAAKCFTSVRRTPAGCGATPTRRPTKLGEGGVEQPGGGSPWLASAGGGAAWCGAVRSSLHSIIYATRAASKPRFFRLRCGVCPLARHGARWECTRDCWSTQPGVAPKGRGGGAGLRTQCAPQAVVCYYAEPRRRLMGSGAAALVATRQGVAGCAQRSWHRRLCM